MFGLRYDGVIDRKEDPILGITSHIMPHRYDAMVNFKLDERCEEMDTYIKKMSEQGIKYSYMHIMIAAMVRLLASKPKLNRFVMNGRVYKRKGIYICFAMKTNLVENGSEVTVKMRFTGEENLFQIKEMIDAEILKNRKQEANDTQKTAKMLRMIPNFLTKITVGTLKFMDRHGVMPRAIIRVSPFHASAWITNMKSISTDYVYHHLYDFGTSGVFIGLGKEHFEPVVNPITKEIEVGKVLRCGVVVDERICDGFYFAKALKYLKSAIKNPAILEEPYVLTDEQKLLNYPKKEAKQVKKQIKMQKKAEKKAKRIKNNQKSAN